MGLKEAANKAETQESKAKLEAEYQKQAALLQKRNERITIAKWDRQQAAQARAAARKTKKDFQSNTKNQPEWKISAGAIQQVHIF